KVLILDIDPQGNASTGLGINRAARLVSTYDVLLGGESLDRAIMRTAVPNLYLVPATVDLSGAELELIDLDRRNFRLRDAIAAA
ncbi:AAA family ATPase, partial [Acinetobacter baumannii]